MLRAPSTPSTKVCRQGARVGHLPRIQADTFSFGVYFPLFWRSVKVTLTHASAEPDSDRADPCPGLRISVLILFCRCDKGLAQGQLRGRKGLFGVHFQVLVHHWRKLGQGLKQDLEGRSVCCFTLTSVWEHIARKIQQNFGGLVTGPLGQGMVSPTVDRALSYQLTIKAAPHWRSCRPVCSQRPLLNGDFPLRWC